MEQKSRVVAGVLGILLGALGIHRFYLGYTKMGIIQLSSTVVSMILATITCGILGFLPFLVVIWGVVEGILILINNTITTDAQGNPLKD